MTEAVTAPDGCMIALPDSWVTLDLDPETAEESLGGVLDLLAREDETVAREREEVGRLLRGLVVNAIDEDALLCAVHFDVDGDGQPLQCSLTVTLRVMDEPIEPSKLLERLTGEGAEAEVVHLAAGPALRVSPRPDDGFLALGMLVPAPGLVGGLGVVTLLSPNTTQRQRLDEVFDLLADTFTFTWAGEPAPAFPPH